MKAYAIIVGSHDLVGIVGLVGQKYDYCASRNRRQCLVQVGMLLPHIIVNIGMTIGMAPVTGLPLPFLSYGGSSLMTMLLMMGIVMNISRNKFTIKR